jgi:4-alpha-glucanotransferase
MIDELAVAAGIAPAYADYFGNVVNVSRDTKLAILNAMGYEVRSNRDAAALLRELAPPSEESGHVVHRAYVPEALENDTAWGFALQLYSLRSARNWGIGDFADLAAFARIATELGAQTIALNPLHLLHVADPARASPYSPLSRLHVNPLYIDVATAAEVLEVQVPQAEAVEQLRASPLVDYEGVSHAKMTALRTMYDVFRSNGTQRTAGFHAFQRAGGVALRRMAIYEALSVQYKTGWMEWPAGYRNPEAPGVEAFAAEHFRDVEFYVFLQWLADMQLGEAARAASDMAVGLYRDLAIGVDAQSVDVWSERDAYCLGLSVGAPPDALNENGQDWGLPPYNPRVLKERAYAPFVAVLRANMRHAGALRIDHVMGLMRLFVIPHGASPKDGAYVRYPFAQLAEILAAESVRNKCMVIGEDLGTLPNGFREQMNARRFFSCRLLYFERGDDGTFCDPADYPHYSVASTGTHDLPPLAGFWHTLGKRDRVQLLQLLNSASTDATSLQIVAAAYRALGRTNAALLLLQMEDALLQSEAVNVPGTTFEAPNWRRKLPVPIDELQDDPGFATIVAALREARSRARSR